MGMTRKRFYTYCYGICASLCMFINGFDASVFNNLQGIPRFMNDMDLDQNAKEDQNLIGAVTSSYMAATIFAGLFVSPFITHYLGRRASIFTGCVVVIVASLIQTFSKNIAAFIGGRIVLGLGQGIALPAGPVFMSEITPPQIRGRMLSFWQMMYSVGALVTSYSALGLERSPFLGDWQWKTITLIQAAIPLICAVCIFLCPESPRWLVQKGKEDKARRAIARVREPEEVEHELQEIKAAIEWEIKYTNNSLRDLWIDKSILRRLILGMVINFGQQITGQSMMNNYSTKVYESVFTDSSTILLINALNYTFGIIFTLTCTFLSDRMGRTTMLTVAGIGQGIMLLIAATVYVATPNIVADDGTVSKTTSVGAALVTVMFLFTFFYKPGWGATVWIYTSEIFPMSVRGTAVSVCTNTQNVSNLVMAQAFPPMFLAMGFYAFYVWMGVNFVLAFLVWWFYPETKGVPLEEMDKLFGGADKTAEVHHQEVDDSSFKDEKAVA
ncbi:MFS sugar transporter-like protein [Phascolomyces articulosus]|uniref:MFS sugar transporter-like protein n=1 Tax=Phascolomyces articulosus TaxID=60185 RepID=A0AAD5JTK2_9FUNG|nr:MFS sugar transporter-like protein [Phascolomyces articulosus]